MKRSIVLAHIFMYFTTHGQQILHGKNILTGVDMEVPDAALRAVSLAISVEYMRTPGAKISRHGPKLDHQGFASLSSDAPTVIAMDDPGEALQAFCV